jgi:hypothetical protein
MKPNGDQPVEIATVYAKDFAAKIQVSKQIEQRCEWSCILWSREHWTKIAARTRITVQQSRDHSPDLKSASIIEEQLLDAQFLSTISQVYSRLYNGDETCSAKRFTNCPSLNKRGKLLEQGNLADIFTTILHKAVSYSMLDKHPLDSGLLHEEYDDVYGVDMTNYQDLETSLRDGRFAKLYEAVSKKALQLAGLSS